MKKIVVVAAADEPGPERHHLHVATRAGGRDRVFAKCALVLDHAEHKLRIESGAGRFVMHGAEEILARPDVGDLRREAPRHLVEPRTKVAPVHVVDRHRPIRDRLRKHGDNGRRELLFHLRTGACRQGRENERDQPDRAGAAQESAGKRHASSFPRIQVPISATEPVFIPASGASPRRAWYSTLPSLSPRSPIVIRCGMPISSKSANITPERSPRSSSSTSPPAASSSSWSLSASDFTASLRS